MNRWTDIGHDHRMSYFTAGDVDPLGLHVEHLTPEGKRCLGYITFDVDGAEDYARPDQMWEVQSWEPLTVTPSLLCNICGDHGFIRDGLWVPA